MMEQTSFSMTFVARGYTSGSPESNTQKPDMQVSPSLSSNRKNNTLGPKTDKKKM
jgi:hypothetical protein